MTRRVKNLGANNGFGARLTIDENAGQLGYFTEPAAVFLPGFNGKLHD